MTAEEIRLSVVRSPPGGGVFRESRAGKHKNVLGLLFPCLLPGGIVGASGTDLDKGEGTKSHLLGSAW